MQSIGTGDAGRGNSAHVNRQASGVRERVERDLGPGAARALVWVMFFGFHPVEVWSGLCLFFFFKVVVRFAFQKIALVAHEGHRGRPMGDGLGGVAELFQRDGRGLE